MNFKTFGSSLQTVLLGLLAVCPLVTSIPAWSQGASGTEEPSVLSADNPAWVVSVAGGLAQGPSTLPLLVDLGGARSIQLNGAVALDRGQAISLSLARQFWGRESDNGERRYPLRLELEGLRTDVQRTQLALGVSTVGLSDQIDIEGIFANAMIRVVKTDHLQGWIGAGAGRIRQSTQDASAVLPGCACLAAAEGDGTVWRAKLRLEWIPDDGEDTDWALFLEGGYSKLPAMRSSAAVFPLSTYDKWGLWTLTGGVRLRF
jgi:hypothetical protein